MVRVPVNSNINTLCLLVVFLLLFMNSKVLCQQQYCLNNADIFFAIDGSGSIRADEFTLEKELSRDIISRLNSSSRSGFAIFDADIHQANTFISGNEVTIFELEGAVQTSGRTNFTIPLEYASNNLFNAANRENYLILISDGIDDGSAIQVISSYTQNLANQGVITVTITFSQYRSSSIINTISSQPRSRFELNFTNISEARNNVDYILKTICKILDPVLDVAATSLSTTEIKVTWSLFHQLNIIVNTYEICVLGNIVDSVCNRKLNVSADYTNGTVGNLNSGATYFVVVYAYTNHGKTPISNKDIVTTKFTTIAPVVLIVKAYISYHDLSAIWTSFDNATSYTICINSTTPDTCDNTISGSETMYIFTLLEAFTLYNVSLFAVVNGQSSGTVSALGRTDQNIPTGPPLNITANPQSPTQIKINWLPPLESLRNGIINMYMVCITTQDTTCNIRKTLNSNEYVQNELLPNTIYTVRIWALTITGLGPAGETTVLTDTLKPVQVEARIINEMKIKVNWSNPNIETMYINIFEVCYSMKNTSICEFSINETATIREIEIGSLRIFTDYFIQIRYLTNQQPPMYSPYSNIATVKNGESDTNGADGQSISSTLWIAVTVILILLLIAQ